MESVTTLPPVLDSATLSNALRTHPDIRILDVRTHGEFEGGHIPSAYNVPLETLGEHGPEMREVTGPVVLVCVTGQRAQRAEAALRTSGMENLHVLEGGMRAWQGAGLRVRKTKHRWDIERQVRFFAGSLVFLGTIAGWLISPVLLVLPALVSGGLAAAALTNTCLMGMVLTKLPYNQSKTCDVPTMVRALKGGFDPLSTPSVAVGE